MWLVEMLVLEEENLQLLVFSLVTEIMSYILFSLMFFPEFWVESTVGKPAAHSCTAYSISSYWMESYTRWPLWSFWTLVLWFYDSINMGMKQGVGKAA